MHFIKSVKSTSHILKDVRYLLVHVRCRLVFRGDQIDLWIVHRGGFIIDLLAGFALTCQSTRLVGVVILTMFHVMNSFIFTIGRLQGFI